MKITAFQFEADEQQRFGAVEDAVYQGDPVWPLLLPKTPIEQQLNPHNPFFRGRNPNQHK